MRQFKFRDAKGIIGRDRKPGKIVSGQIIVEQRGENFVAKIQVGGSILRDVEFVTNTEKRAETLAVKYVNDVCADVEWV